MGNYKKGGIGKTFKKIGNDIKKFGEKVGDTITGGIKKIEKVKVRPPKKQHTVRNKSKSVVKKKTEVKKEVKKDALKFTHLLQKNWKKITGFYAIVLFFRLAIIFMSNISHSISFYIKFILFFTLQYFGYAVLLIASVFSIETVILITSTTLITAIKRLLEPFKPHPFLKYYPINDYLWTHLLPRTLNIGFILFGIILLLILFFIFIVPFAILLLGYTK